MLLVIFCFHCQFWITEDNWIKSLQSSCQRPDKSPERRQMFVFHAGRTCSVTVVKDIWPVCLLIPGGEDWADTHSRRQVGGREKMKENRKCLLGKETCHGGVKWRMGRVRWRDESDGLPVNVSWLMFLKFTTGWSFSVLLGSGWTVMNFSWTICGIFLRVFNVRGLWERNGQCRKRKNTCGSSPGSAG